MSWHCFMCGTLTKVNGNYGGLMEGWGPNYIYREAYKEEKAICKGIRVETRLILYVSNMKLACVTPFKSRRSGKFAVKSRILAETDTDKHGKTSIVSF